MKSPTRLLASIALSLSVAEIGFGACFPINNCPTGTYTQCYYAYDCNGGTSCCNAHNNGSCDYVGDAGGYCVSNSGCAACTTATTSVATTVATSVATTVSTSFATTSVATSAGCAPMATTVSTDQTQNDAYCSCTGGTHAPASLTCYSANNTWGPFGPSCTSPYCSPACSCTAPTTTSASTTTGCPPMATTSSSNQAQNDAYCGCTAGTHAPASLTCYSANNAWGPFGPTCTNPYCTPSCSCTSASSCPAEAVTTVNNQAQNDAYCGCTGSTHAPATLTCHSANNAWGPFGPTCTPAYCTPACTCTGPTGCPAEAVTTVTNQAQNDAYCGCTGSAHAPSTLTCHSANNAWGPFGPTCTNAYCTPACTCTVTPQTCTGCSFWNPALNNCTPNQVFCGGSSATHGSCGWMGACDGGSTCTMTSTTNGSCTCVSYTGVSPQTPTICCKGGNNFSFDSNGFTSATCSNVSQCSGGCLLDGCPSNTACNSGPYTSGTCYCYPSPGAPSTMPAGPTGCDPTTNCNPNNCVDVPGPVNYGPCNCPPSDPTHGTQIGNSWCMFTECPQACTPAGCAHSTYPKNICVSIADGGITQNCTCPTTCGNRVCDPGEDSTNCSVDCGSGGGGGTSTPIGPICGNGVCEVASGESCACADCNGDPRCAPPICGPTTICGYITQTEATGTGQNGILVEARSAQGRLLRSMATVHGGPNNADGYFAFNNLLGNVLITPIVPKSQLVVPQQPKKFFVQGDQANFLVPGNPVTIHFTGTANTIVALTNAPFTGLAPPSSTNTLFAFSGTLDKTGNLTMNIPGGHNYQVYCWSAVANVGSRTSYNRGSPTAPSGNSTASDLYSLLHVAQTTQGTDYSQTPIACP